MLGQAQLHWSSLSIKEANQFYDNLNDEDWFMFVKRYVLLLKSQILQKNIVLSILPLFIIHIIAQYSICNLYPLFVIPNNNICRFCIQSQKKKFILKRFVYKFEFVICNKKLQIIHKLTYHTNKGIFSCCSMDKNEIKCMNIKCEGKPIVRINDKNELHVSIEMQYNQGNIQIFIQLKNNNNNEQLCSYEISDEILTESCGVGLLNVDNYINLVPQEYGTCAVSYKGAAIVMCKKIYCVKEEKC